MSSDLQCVGVIARWAWDKGGGSYKHSERLELIFFPGDRIHSLTPDPAGDFEEFLASRLHLYSGETTVTVTGNLRHLGEPQCHKAFRSAIVENTTDALANPKAGSKTDWKLLLPPSC